MVSSTTLWLGAGMVMGAGIAAYAVTRNNHRMQRLPADDRDLRTDVPVQERVIASGDGGELFTTSAGDINGPTVVLAHCWTGSQRTWTPVARRLVRAGCHVIRWDQRGHGRSQPGSKGCTIEALGEDLATVLAAYEATDVVLVGHSMGGMTAMSYAVNDHADFDRRVKSLLLVDTAGFGMENPVSKMAPEVLGQEWLDAWAESPVMHRWMLRATLGTWAAPEHLRIMAEDFSNTSKSGRVDFAREFADLELRSGLGRINKPTTIMVGSLDVLTPVPLARAMHSAIPGSTLRVYPHMGHMLPMEDPDAVADGILAAVARRSTIAPLPRQRAGTSLAKPAEAAEAAESAEATIGEQAIGGQTRSLGRV